MTRLRLPLANLITLLLATLLMVAAASAQTYTTLASFNGTNGAGPTDALVQGLDGNFYGTTADGGTQHLANGTAFQITPGGTITTLYSFCTGDGCPDGCNPHAGLLQSTDTHLYGITPACGEFGGGTIFTVASAGGMTIIYNFCALTNCADGRFPTDLIQAADGNIYGTTLLGGVNAPGFNDGGTVFKIATDGTLTTLYNFCAQANCTDGDLPNSLIQGSDGNFYGTTVIGGAFGEGSVFELSPRGLLKTIHSFCSRNTCPDGRQPVGIIQGANGALFGTTQAGGSANCNFVGCGVVFKITPGSGMKALHVFCSQGACADGANPGPLVQGSDGTLYGTTSQMGASGFGTIFQISGRTFTTLHALDGVDDGGNPDAGVFQATDGNFYGTASSGGDFGGGTVFTLSTGLSPFVRTLPASGRVGASVIILGNGLTDTSSVTFNGTAASFTMVSDTELQTTVPSGATSGRVQVMTPSGTLTSNIVFRVRP